MTGPIRKLTLTEFRGPGPLTRYATPKRVVGQKYACAAQKKVLIRLSGRAPASIVGLLLGKLSTHQKGSLFLFAPI